MGTSRGGPVCLPGISAGRPFTSAGGQTPRQRKSMSFSCVDRPQGLCQPPWSLIGRCAQKTQTENCTVILITQKWPSQPCFPVLLQMLVDIPHQLPDRLDLMSHPSGGEIPPTSRSLVSGHLASLRESYSTKGLQRRFNLLLASWRQSTNKNYNSAWSLWESWCVGRGTSSLTSSIESILLFLMEEFMKGKQHRL